MDGYLLDTNAASVLWDAKHRDHEKIWSFLQERSEDPIWISVIVLAEVEYGLKTAPNADADRQRAVRNEMAKFPFVLEVDKHTIPTYSALRAELFRACSPVNSRGRLTVKWPEDLCERTTAKALGIQENDLWIASQAIQYNLISVTDDRMARIQDVSDVLNDPLRMARWR